MAALVVPYINLFGAPFTLETAEEVKITRTEKTKAKKSKEKPLAVKPLTPEELKQIISQSKENEDDDCLMCGS